MSNSKKSLGIGSCIDYTKVYIIGYKVKAYFIGFVMSRAIPLARLHLDRTISEL
jgi:hypothetical protein